MSLLLQDGLVTLFSLGAAALLVHRLVNVIRPRAAGRQCAACPHCTSPASQQQPATTSK